MEQNNLILILILVMLLFMNNCNKSTEKFYNIRYRTPSQYNTDLPELLNLKYYCDRINGETDE